MLYTDIKYIQLISPYLRNFRNKGGNLFNCSCPICGDSQKKLTKSRGYFFKHKNSIFYKCHNCQASMSLGSFLKRIFPSQYEEYVFEKYKDKKIIIPAENKLKEIVPPKKTSYTHMKCLSLLEPEHYAKQYIINRQIPREAYNRLYYTDDFSLLANELFPEKYKNIKPKDQRIILPFFDRQLNLIGIQGRSLSTNNKDLRYVTAKNDSESSLIFGIELLDLTKTIFVLEGPFDSLFIPNSVAVAGTDLVGINKKISSIGDIVLIFDNQPRNKQIIKLMEETIQQNYKICIWPNNLEEKDINDMILAGRTSCDILDIIETNVFSGIRANLEFNRWKKC